ncbi:MAG: M23 family metallopeptidase [Bacteroidota bacterium]
MVKGFLVFIFLLFVHFVIGQALIPNTFISPVTYEMKLAGTFGELRSNHFHAGIDIKSPNGQEGSPIVAIEDGFVSRLAVKPRGYGKAIYLDHPSGHTSVYGHLQKFVPRLAEFAKQKQYELESFQVDISINSDSLFFNKGDTIGFLGNTGSSAGPHLHFEIRNTKTEVPINPLLFGYNVKDSRKPFVRDLRAYLLDKEHHSFNQQKIDLRKTKEGYYTSAEDTVNIGAWRTSLACYTLDQMNGAPNRNGVFAISLYVDDTIRFHFTMDSIPFDKSRYLNAHLDYAAFKKNRKQRREGHPNINLYHRSPFHFSMN